MKTKFKLLTLFGLLISVFSYGQLGENKEVFTHQDSLRGTLNENRTWWDVLHYSILVSPDFETRSITGKTDIRFKVLKAGKQMQIDLQSKSPLIWLQTIFQLTASPSKKKRPLATGNEPVD